VIYRVNWAKPLLWKWEVAGLVFSLVAVATGRAQTSATSGEWPAYGNDPGGSRYSPLTQINRGNVSHLKVAWVFHTGDISDGSHDRKRSGFETTPMTYQLGRHGKQYVVIAAGGHARVTEEAQNDNLVAFTLP